MQSRISTDHINTYQAIILFEIFIRYTYTVTIRTQYVIDTTRYYGRTQITNPMELSPSLEADSPSDGPQIPRVCEIEKFSYVFIRARH